MSRTARTSSQGEGKVRSWGWRNAQLTSFSGCRTIWTRSWNTTMRTVTWVIGTNLPKTSYWKQRTTRAVSIAILFWLPGPKEQRQEMCYQRTFSYKTKPPSMHQLLTTVRISRILASTQKLISSIKSKRSKTGRNRHQVTSTRRRKKKWNSFWKATCLTMNISASRMLGTRSAIPRETCSI